MSPEMRPKSFGTFEKLAPDLKGCFISKLGLQQNESTYIHTYIHKFICLGGSEKATLKADVDPPNKSVKK